ncbi:MAG: hypothetical protein HY963_03965, partial [Ignavibacteriales bacterium]|nr:hypothetical protein [Ignavibacteriales bacterium]
IKAMIIQKIFGTTSKTEIEKMNVGQLNFNRAALEELFTELKEIENPIEYLTNYKKVS